MRIVLQTENQKTWQLRVPTGLLLNRLTVSVMNPKMKKRGICLPGNQAASLKKSLRAVQKRHPDLVLLEFEGASGEKVKIII